MNICTKKVLRVVISVRSPYRCLYTGTDDDANDVVHKLMNVFFLVTQVHILYIYLYIFITFQREVCRPSTENAPLL